ncbi:MAG: TetR/AcrR family transcriptional regulator [Polyangiaceae bacterium]|nr:TetR/AcrR family transcriptional regulator [Polyangiaceae bacterium]
MSRGESTRQAILDRGLELATRVGLGGLTIGQLADELKMSKSGLFAHFKSKETLQVQVLGAAVDLFVDEVVRPALKVPRGEPRVRALFERWLSWGLDRPSGCFFAAASFELDDQPGPAREALLRAQRDWLETLAQAVRIAIREGHFDESVDPDRTAFTLLGIMLAAHEVGRLLGDPRARSHAHATFEDLVAQSRPRVG